MAAGAARAAKPRRKRARKTRTAIVSDASSSSSPESSSSSSSDEEPGPAFGRAEKVATTTTGSDSQADSDSDSSSSGESSSSSSSSSQAFETSRGGQSRNVEGRWNTRVREAQSLPPEIKQDFSDSSEDEGHEKVTLDSQCRKLQPPTPVLRSELVEEAAQKRQEGLRIKNEKKAAILAQQRQTAGDSMTREEEFQAMWMRMMVDGFGEELDALRKVRSVKSLCDGRTGC